MRKSPYHPRTSSVQEPIETYELRETKSGGVNKFWNTHYP